MMDIQEELEDRFSDIPQSVQNLMDISYIRSIGKKLGILEIKERKEEIIITFEGKDRLDQNLSSALIKNYSKRIGFKLGEQPAFGYIMRDVKKEEKLKDLKELFEFMNKISNFS